MFKWLNRFRRPEKRYDDKGHMVYYNDRRKNEVFYTFNDSGELIQRVRNGYCELYKEYDENNKLTYRSLSGYKEWWEYDESDRLIKHSTSDGKIAEYFYYRKGILIKTTKNNICSWSFIGDGVNNINDIINEYIDSLPNALADILGESL